MRQLNQRARAVVASVPAPVGGWNTRDELDNMPEQFAPVLTNWFPERSQLTLKKGHRQHTTGGMGGDPVKTLAVFNASDGTKKLIGCSNGNVYNCTTFNANASSLGSGFSDDAWQWQMMRDKLIMVNGVDQPQQFDGTTLSNAAYTGIADDSVFIAVIAHRGRLYFIERDSCSVWYGELDAVTGGVTEFDVQSEFKLGGSLMAHASWSTDAGSNLGNYLLLVSELGEVLVYGGSYPGGSDWELVSRAVLPPPLGRRCLTNYGKDVYMATLQGLYPLGSTLFGQKAAGAFDTLSDLIQPTYNSAAAARGTLFGWQIVNYPKKHRLIVNVPLVSLSQAEQYVMNTQTGAWCRFRGEHALCWVIFNDTPYFGTKDGKVMQADYGGSHDGAYIETEVQHAFSTFGVPGLKKRFAMAKPFITANNKNFRIYADFITDWQQRTITATVTVQGTGSTPWGSPWGSPWSGKKRLISYWINTNGHGVSASLVYRGAFLDMEASLSSSLVSVIPGGVGFG